MCPPSQEAMSSVFWRWCRSWKTNSSPSKFSMISPTTALMRCLGQIKVTHRWADRVCEGNWKLLLLKIHGGLITSWLVYEQLQGDLGMHTVWVGGISVEAGHCVYIATTSHVEDVCVTLTLPSLPWTRWETASLCCCVVVEPTLLTGRAAPPTGGCQTNREGVSG